MSQSYRRTRAGYSFKTFIYFFLLIVSVLVSFSLSKKYYFQFNAFRTLSLNIINLPLLKFESVFFPLNTSDQKNALEEARIKLLAMESQNIVNNKISAAVNKLLESNFKKKNIILIKPNYYSSNGFLTEVIFLTPEEAKISANMPVISSEGLYGRVAQTQQNGAINIISIFNVFSRIPVYTKTSKIYGMAAGNGFELTFLYNNINSELLIEGEEVLTSGENNLLIPDLPVGKIKKEGNRNYITPFVNERPSILGIIQN